MAQTKSEAFGTLPIGHLLIKQAVPASIGILVMSLNIVVDTIFVGRWIGHEAIAAINVVLPVSFFIAALGMAIGIGGASIISRALGELQPQRALGAFGNQISLTILLSIGLVIPGLIFADEIILAFGGRNELFELAKSYYVIVLYGVPLLALSMMGNNTIRAEGKPNYAMISMIIPSVSNLVLDYILINRMGYGMEGAAWATTLSYFFSFAYILSFFLSKRSELKIKWHHLGFEWTLVKEITSLGFVTLARQAVVSVVYLITNNILEHSGGTVAVAVYAIIGRMLMFALFPVLGITQGFLPVAGFNYGARKFDRVEISIWTAIKYSTLLGMVIFLFIMGLAYPLTRLFTEDPGVLAEAPAAMRWVFAATPLVAIQLIGSAYFQAIGKAVPALLLTLSRQGFLLIPLLLLLHYYYGLWGVWISFPIADVLSTLITAYFLNKEVKTHLLDKGQENSIS